MKQALYTVTACVPSGSRRTTAKKCFFSNRKDTTMNEIWNFAKRNCIWLLLGGLAAWLLVPSLPEVKTLLLISVTEALAIALSGAANYAYTAIDFANDANSTNSGLIFLGVHVCIGLVVLGVYLAQFSM